MSPDDRIRDLIESKDLGGAWQAAVTFSGNRHMTYLDFLEAYIWGREQK